MTTPGTTTMRPPPLHNRRRYEILQLLIRCGEITTRQAARHLGVSRRLALGDLQALDRNGVPLHQEGEGRERRWVLADSWRVLGTEIGPMHRVATMLGRQLLGSFLHDTAISDALGDLDRRVRSLGGVEEDGQEIDERWLYYRPLLETDYSGQRDLIATLLDALRGRRRLRLYYRAARPRDGSAGGAAVKEYPCVSPLTLVVYNHALYLLAESRDHRRLFALERITEIADLDLAFDYPRKSEYTPERFFDGRFGITSEPGPVEEVVLRFAAAMEPYVRRRRWMPGQRIVKLDDGRVELRFRAKGRELLSHILKWGEMVEVLEPEQLRTKVATVLRQALSRYEQPPPG